MRKTCCSLGVLIKVKQVCVQSRIHWVHMTQAGTRHSSRSTMLRHDCKTGLTQAYQRRLKTQMLLTFVARFTPDNWLVPVEQSDLPWCPFAIQHSHLHISGHVSGPHLSLSKYMSVEAIRTPCFYSSFVSHPRCFVLSCQHCLPLTMKDSE